ncbi:unnamed protein product [Coffea canephora]|uniref:Transcription factor RAX3-like n=2 Tax=Coffea TaxID=13442 RepID=A0A068U280_COFCA|nr:unnamed protein product [Coffea canephora]
MGRAPCCDKANVKRGPWSPEEDAKLKAYIEQYGTGGNWIALPQKIGLRRCGKSCRLRWLNYLRPNIKHGGFSEEEDSIICSLYMNIGSRWSIIAAQLPGRTDNDIKNYWNTKLKKKLLGKQRKDQRTRAASSLRQEMNRKKENFMTTEAIHVLHSHQLQQPLAFPAVIPQQQAHDVEDQAVIIAGKLSADDQQANGNSFNNHNSLYSCDISFGEGQACENPLSMASCSQQCSPSSYYPIHGVIANSNIPCYSSFLFHELNGMEYINNFHQSDTLQSFSGTDTVNRSTITGTSPESTSWGDTNSLVYSPIVSCYEICQQPIQQSCTLEKSSYFRMQQETVLQ